MTTTTDTARSARKQGASLLIACGLLTPYIATAADDPALSGEKAKAPAS
jgi:hypothetical protein